MKILVMAAVAQNGAIGKNNQLLWQLPDDMAFFKKTTLHHTIISGRKNYESIPLKYRPLAKRINIVITRQINYNAPGAYVVHSLEEGIEKARQLQSSSCIIIGGGEIYRECLNKNLADELLITHIHHSYPDADVFFPDINPADWKEVEIVAQHPADDHHLAAFTIKKYIRIK